MAQVSSFPTNNHFIEEDKIPSFEDFKFIIEILRIFITLISKDFRKESTIEFITDFRNLLTAYKDSSNEIKEVLCKENQEDMLMFIIGICIED